MALTACSARWTAGEDFARATRPVATSTPAVEAAARPVGGLLKQPPESTRIPPGMDELGSLSTLEQLARITAPTRDLRDLALRLNPEVGKIPLVLSEAPPAYAVGDPLDFWVHDLGANRNFQITAELIHKTDVAYVWVEQGKPVDREAVIEAVDRFSRQSYPAVSAFFGSEWKPGVDGDPRLHILHATGMGDGIAGYYSSADQYSRLARNFSNEKEIFYINLTWLNNTRNYKYYETVLAHEFQHMIHWYRDRNEETWVNEGLSEFAQEVAGFDPSTLFARTFATVPDTQLNTWGEDQGNNGAHYGSAYLFMAYFAQRFGAEMTRALVAHPANGIRGFDAVLSNAGFGLTFDDLFADWVVATYVDDPNALGQDGVYGYRQFVQDPPALTATHAVYPTEGQAGTVRNYAADYILLEGSGDLQIHFRGETDTQLADLAPASGRAMWWSNRGDDFDTRLTRRFDLSSIPPGAPVEMTANFWYRIEDGYDFGYVLASRDGERWTILPGEATVEDPSSGNAFGPGYSGTSGGGPTWISDRFDLSAFAGGEVWIRFEYVTDDAVSTGGWFVDDVAIPAIGYTADFEQGADGWQSEGWLLTDNHLPQRWLVQLLLLEDNRLAAVERVPVDAEGRATVSVDGLDGRRTAVLVISGLTPATTEPASYEYWVDTR